jgi:ribonuclease Z
MSSIILQYYDEKFVFLSLIILSSNIYADIIKVTILGSGTPRVNIDRFSQSILVEHKNDKFLFDAGRGALLRLKSITYFT